MTFMAKINSKKVNKVKLGKKTEEAYEYSAKIDFKEDFSTQVANLIKEKKANDFFELKIKKIKEEIKIFSKREKYKSLSYYYLIGKKLLFLKDNPFKDIVVGSVFRRIFEEVPEILPNIIDRNMAIRHLHLMYGIAHVKKKDLRRASWDQWFEITKFRGTYTKPRILNQILKECETGITGHSSLNIRIKEIIKESKKN